MTLPTPEDVRLLLVLFLRRYLHEPSRLREVLRQAAERGFTPEDFPEVDGLLEALMKPPPIEE